MIDIQKLKEYGFTQFNIKDVDVNLYNQLSDLIDDGAEKYQENLRIVRTSFLESYENLSDIHLLLGGVEDYQIEMLDYDEREDGRLTKITVIFNSHQLATEFKKRVYKPHRTFEQFWFYNMGLPEETKPLVHKIFSKIIDEVYNKKLLADKLTYEFTWYGKDCIISSHEDVWSGDLPDPMKQCSILLYLNKHSYDESDGGYLCVDNDKNKVYPKFGNVAMLEYDHIAQEHRVEPPKTDYGRYGFLSFVDRKFIVSKDSLI